MRDQSQHYVLGFMFKSQPPVIAYEMVEECRSTLKNASAER